MQHNDSALFEPGMIAVAIEPLGSLELTLKFLV